MAFLYYNLFHYLINITTKDCYTKFNFSQAMMKFGNKVFFKVFKKTKQNKTKIQRKTHIK